MELQNLKYKDICITKIEQNGDITFDTAWRPLKEDLKQKVEDRYVIKDADVSNENPSYIKVLKIVIVTN